jgi:mono/diheme cytochrome c family protein
MTGAEAKRTIPPGGGRRKWGGRGLLLALAACAGLTSWSARADNIESTRSTAMTTEPGDTAVQLFEQRCARCHEEDGTGSSLRDNVPQIPNFRNRAWHVGRSDVELVVAILEGKGTRMPAFAGRISEPEARALVKHIRAFEPSSRPRTVAPATDFDRRFRELQMELEDLRKRFWKLAAEPSKT